MTSEYLHRINLLNHIPRQIPVIPLKNPGFFKHLVSDLNLPQHILSAYLRSFKPNFVLLVLRSDIKILNGLNVPMNNAVKYLVPLRSLSAQMPPLFDLLLDIFENKLYLFVHEFLIKLRFPHILSEVYVILKLLVQLCFYLVLR